MVSTLFVFQKSKHPNFSIQPMSPLTARIRIALAFSCWSRNLRPWFVRFYAILRPRSVGEPHRPLSLPSHLTSVCGPPARLSLHASQRSVRSPPRPSRYSYSALPSLCPPTPHSLPRPPTPPDYEPAVRVLGCWRRRARWRGWRCWGQRGSISRTCRLVRGTCRKQPRGHRRRSYRVSATAAAGVFAPPGCGRRDGGRTRCGGGADGVRDGHRYVRKQHHWLRHDHCRVRSEHGGVWGNPCDVHCSAGGLSSTATTAAGNADS